MAVNITNITGNNEYKCLAPGGINHITIPVTCGYLDGIIDGAK